MHKKGQTQRYAERMAYVQHKTSSLTSRLETCMFEKWLALAFDERGAHYGTYFEATDPGKQKESDIVPRVSEASPFASRSPSEDGSSRQA
jgi:hypothetical protein